MHLLNILQELDDDAPDFLPYASIYDSADPIMYHRLISSLLLIVVETGPETVTLRVFSHPWIHSFLHYCFPVVA